VVGVELAWYGLVQHDDVALFKVLNKGVQVLEVETAAGVIAALWRGREIDHLATGNASRGVVILTSSSSRSMAESAFMMEPLSDSMEEEILPAPRRSVGLGENMCERGTEWGE